MHLIKRKPIAKLAKEKNAKLAWKDFILNIVKIVTRVITSHMEKEEQNASNVKKIA
jgi:hypothetical protein